MRNLIKLIFFLPRKYIFLCFSIIAISLLISSSEVLVLSSIKPFIRSFSSINFDGITNNLEITLTEANQFLIKVVICGILRVFLIFFQYKIAAMISAKISSKAFKKIINQDYISLKSADQSI